IEKANPGKRRLREQPIYEARESRASHAQVLPIARGVLGDQDELGNALCLDRLRLRDERRHGAAALPAAHLRDRAEGAGIVAALPDLQVRVAAPPREEARRGLVVEACRERL